jgi:GT2 family glycosyltransferase
MRVSILVGAHNEGDRLWKTVESILETVGELDAELIVGDDGSTDRSVRELQHHFPQILVVKQKKRMGVAAARGLAAGRARGEILIFLDGHSKPEPGALERLVASVEKTHGEAVITPQIVGLDESTWRSQPQQIGNGYALDLETFDSWWLPLKKMREVKEGRQSFYESPALIGCALAVSRELYDRLWGFDQHMRQWGSEDVDFALKAWTMGARVLHDPGATVAHRFQRYFGDYEVSAEYPLANQIRMARKHFTQSVWEDWLVRAQEQQRLKLKDRPEGLWASAWEVFQRDRASAEHERAYLLSRRQRDEFWYAKRFERSWPTMGGANLLAQPALPPHVLFAEPLASPLPYPASVKLSSTTSQGPASGCKPHYSGWQRAVIMQVLDQYGNPYKVANVELVESFTINSNGLNITITANPNPFYTDDLGQYTDSFYCCSALCPGSNATTATQHHTANGKPIADITIVYKCTSITVGGL